MLVMTTGHKRFKLQETWTQDNYTVAKVSYFTDKDISPEERNQAKELHDSLKKFLLDRFGSMQSALEEKFGKMPTDSSDFSFWLSSVFPFGTQVNDETSGGLFE